MELDGAAGSQDALPGERSHGRSAQQLRHLTVIERVAGGGGDLPVSGYLAARDLADGFAESGVAPRIPGSAQQFSRCFARGYGPMRTAEHVDQIVADSGSPKWARSFPRKRPKLLKTGETVCRLWERSDPFQPSCRTGRASRRAGHAQPLRFQCDTEAGRRRPAEAGK